MEIREDINGWIINEEYAICGNKDDGYKVRNKEDHVVYENKDFESCLCWVARS